MTRYEGRAKSFEPEHIRLQFFYNLYSSETWNVNFSLTLMSLLRIWRHRNMTSHSIKRKRFEASQKSHSSSWIAATAIINKLYDFINYSDVTFSNTPARVHKKGVFDWYINNNKNFGLIYRGSKLFARPSYSYAVGVFGTVIFCPSVCRLSVTDVLWLNGAR